MMRAMLLLLSGLLLLAPPARADDQRGLILAREAQRALEYGLPEVALVLLEQARLEWPDGDEVLHLMADAYTATDDLPAALGEYAKASTGPHAFRARFNAGSLMSRVAEQGLEAAGVPLDIAGLPAEADPAPLITAIDEAMPRIAAARSQFLEALALRSHGPARESVAALTARLDELAAMRDELEKRQDKQQEEGDDQDQQEQDDQQDQDQQQEDDQQQDQQDGSDQDQQSPPPDEQQEGQDEPPDASQQPPEAQPARPLTAAERAELLDKLEQLEAQALQLAREQRARERVAVEKDW